MMTLADYLAMGTDPTSLAASALAADQTDHAMAATCVTLADMAAQQDATGHVMEGAIMRRAARWLTAETEAHRRVRDELVERSGYGEVLLEFMRERRATAVATREASAPLFNLCGQYLRLALRRAAVDEAEALLATRTTAGVLAADAVLGFSAAIKGPTNAG